MNNQEADKGNVLSILLLIIPAAALVFAWFQKKHFIPPADFQNFMLFSLKASSLACLLLFVLAFWKTKKSAVLVMILIVFEVFWCFGGIALLPIVNVKYDSSETKVFEKKVLQVYRGSKRSSNFIRVESWGNPNDCLHPPGHIYDSVQQLKSVIRFTTRSGYLGYEYVTSLEVMK